MSTKFSYGILFSVHSGQSHVVLIQVVNIDLQAIVIH